MIISKIGRGHVNHMNHDVAEVNGSDPPMLPGSFLYEKEPGYEASAVQRMAFYFLLFVHHIEDETQTRSMVRALTWNKVGSHKYIVDVPVLPGLEHTKSRRGIEPSH